MKRFVAVILLFAMMVAVIPAAQADLMSEARSMLQMINDFRTGGNAWYWNRDNKTKTQKRGLARLQYDEELEAVALVRAKELAVLFDHTRPDGSAWYTVSDVTCGENLGKGQSSSESVMTAWMNSDSHRYNILLADYKTIGVACYACNGKYYWVQEFGY